MRAQMLHRIAEASAQMLHQRLRKGFIAVKGNRLVQNGEISRFADVSICAGNKPEWIVIKAATYCHVPLFGERLILVVCTAVRELGSRDIQYACSCPLRDHMHKAEQVLAGITEAHPASHAALKVAGRTAHVEGDHALILVPDIHHPADVLIGAFQRKAGEEAVPEFCQLLLCGVEALVRAIALLHSDGSFFVDDSFALPLFLIRIFNITEA